MTKGRLQENFVKGFRRKGQSGGLRASQVQRGQDQEWERRSASKCALWTNAHLPTFSTKSTRCGHSTRHRERGESATSGNPSGGALKPARRRFGVRIRKQSNQWP